MHTPDGAVRGRWRGASAAFLGIPFAQPPVGALRFATPVPVEPWDGVRDARAHGATPQRVASPAALIPEPSVPGDATLNVDVFTPRPGEPDAALPVLVWIHGGGFVAGSPASPWYDGAAFTRDGVVTVTVSYRLGLDGFGVIPGAPSNRGVRDWLAALEWVQRSIGAFGGDPGRVTIAGQSAGGGAVLTLLGMPRAQHLFHAAWAASPAAGDIPAERAATFTAKLARLAGVRATGDGLASIPEEALPQLQEDAAASPDGGVDALVDRIRNGTSWGPVLDGDLLTRPVLDAIRAGAGADKPLVIGTTDDEFTMTAEPFRRLLRLLPASVVLARFGVPRATRAAYLRANRAQRAKGTAAMLGRYVTDMVFRAPAVRIAAARGHAPTWAYRFVWRPPEVGWACHCLDVPFFFDCLDVPEGIARLAGARPPQALADAVHAAAAGFVRDGNAGWMPWSQHPGTTRLFGAAPSALEVIPHGYASVLPLA